MKLLFTLGALRVGGYEILSIDIADELIKLRNSVAILSLSKLDEISKRINKGVKIYFAPRHFRYDLTILIRIAKVLRNFNPDIIMTGAFFDYFLVRFASIIGRKRAKFILSFHLTKPYDKREYRWNRMFTSLARIFDDDYIAVHKSQIYFYNYHYGLPRSRFSLIYNGVDINHYKPLDKCETKDDGIFRIIHVANLKPLKDQWTLLKAMTELNKTHRRWELKIAGRDQSNILQRYKSFIQKHDLTAKIEFLGPVDDIREVLSGSDVFVLTSVTESFPISLLEAMAMGLPCIVTSVGGAPDAIENGKEGFLVKPRDYKAISKYLTFLIENPDRRKEMGINARKRVVIEFNSKVMLERYLRLFNKVLKE